MPGVLPSRWRPPVEVPSSRRGAVQIAHQQRVHFAATGVLTGAPRRYAVFSKVPDLKAEGDGFSVEYSLVHRDFLPVH